MNLQRLDKEQTLRSIYLKNSYKAFLWKKNRSRLKYIESLSNNIQESGIRFILLWENLDFFLKVRDKYDDINDAKIFIDECLEQFNLDNDYPPTYSLYKNYGLSEIIEKAVKGDEVASAIVECRFIIYSSAYDLLHTIVAKVLSGYTLEVAYYEATNKILPNEIEDLESVHTLFAEYFTIENEEEYVFKPYRLYSTNEFILQSDISALIDIVCEITDAHIYCYDLITPSREGKIFEEPESEFKTPAILHEFDSEPNIEYRGIRMEVAPKDLEKEIFVCCIYLDWKNEKIATLHNDTVLTAEDVAQTLKYLIGKTVYIHPLGERTLDNQIEISWVEAL